RCDQLNLWPRVSLPETSSTLRWTGEVGDATVFQVWGSRAFVRDTSADKLSPRAIPCVFLGFVPDMPGWQFYHPTLHRVLRSQDVTFDESVPFYCLFPYRSTPPPPSLLFLAPDPLPGRAPVQGAETGGAEPGGVVTGGAEPGGVGTGGAEPEGVERGGDASEGSESGGATGAGGAGGAGAGGAGVAARAGGAGVAAGASGAGGAAATYPGGARTQGTGAAGTGGVEGDGVVGPGAGGAGAAKAGGGGTGVKE
ncbi:unnamed protein product, partial [Closterium sp. NIES-53]